MKYVEVDVEDGLAHAWTDGCKRKAAAEQRKAQNKDGYTARSDKAEQRSIIGEMAVVRWTERSIFEHRYYYPNIWDSNKNKWVAHPAIFGTDVGRIEVRSGAVGAGLQRYGKDYLHRAWNLQVFVDTNDKGYATGRVVLLGWNDAKEDWTGLKPCHDRKRYPDFPWDVRRDLSTMDMDGVYV